MIVSALDFPRDRNAGRAGGSGKLTVAVQCVHASKRLLAAIAGVRAQVEVQGFVPLAVVLAGEALLATRPLALEWSLLIVRSQVTYQRTIPLQRHL
jgi:uncharacterized protein (DUF697 family)